MDGFKTGLQWLAIRVKPNFEKTVSLALQPWNCDTFLPLQRQRHQWSDRLKDVDIPLFRGYLFCKTDLSNRLHIVRMPGVFGFLCTGKTPSCIPDVEIESLRLLLNSGVPANPFPYLQVGERVVIDEGPLKGLEGILQEIKSGYRIIVSINLLQRSIMAEVDAAWLRVIRQVKRAS